MSKMLSLGHQFSKDLNKLAKNLEKWSEQAQKKIETAHKRIGKRWQAEAVKRVPVDTGTLKQRILTNTYREGNKFITECGSNVPYAPFVEFGTRHIAGGRVLAAGAGPDVTDAQAITVWPAKNRDIVDEHSGIANQRVVKAIEARLSRSGSQEQMPWLRPAFNSIRDWVIQELTKATEPPQK